jgi:hypothetical protein
MPYKKVKVISYKPDIFHVSCAFEKKCFFIDFHVLNTYIEEE